MLAELRANRRFAYLPSFVSTAPTEHPLVDDIKRVRDIVRPSARGSAYDVPPPTALAAIMEPFFKIVRSRDTSGSITGVALLSLDRISAAVLFRLAALDNAHSFSGTRITERHKDVHNGDSHLENTNKGKWSTSVDGPKSRYVLADYAPILNAIVAAAASCRFDASDPARDEVVLARIVRVVARVITHPVAASALSDAMILRGFESCLTLAAERRRTSDLLKKTADAALVDIAVALTTALEAQAKLRSPLSAPTGRPHDNGEATKHPEPSQLGKNLDFSSVPATPSSAAIMEYLGGSSYASAFDVDAHSQTGPSTTAALGAIVELASRMADPATNRPESDRLLGLQLLSAVLHNGGEVLQSDYALRRLLMRECSRAVLRAVGTFSGSAAYISAAFNAASQLVYTLGSDATQFMSALLNKVFPYYISGYSGVAPKIASRADFAGLLPDSVLMDDSDDSSRENASGLQSGPTNGLRASTGTHSRGGAPDGSAADVAADPEAAHARVQLDPIARETGLEALCGLLSTPGLLSSTYQVTDCHLGSVDVVTSILLALGGATTSRLLRRRSKRLRTADGAGVSSSALSSAIESDDEDDDGIGVGGSTSESARQARSAALLCAECLLAVADSIEVQMKESRAVSSGFDSQSGGGIPGDPPEVAEQSARFREDRKKKLILQDVADAFNSPSFKPGSASKVIKLLRDHGQGGDLSKSQTVEDEKDADVAAVVRFFRETPGLNKERIGVVLGEPDGMSKAVLNSYTAMFDFADRPFTECLRIYLESFRLPGEAQKIDRIVESFATRFYEQNMPGKSGSEQHPADGPNGSVLEPDGAELLDTRAEAVSTETNVPSRNRHRETPNGVEATIIAETGPALSSPELGSEVQVSWPDAPGTHTAAFGRPRSARGVLATPDAAHVLSYAVVMLNTDQHNMSIKKKMTFEDFLRNNRGINGGNDLPRWFLAEIFSSIAAVEIRMSDEAGIGSLTDLHWDERLKESFSRELPLPPFSESSVLGEDVFAIAWIPCVCAASVMFNEASDAGSVQKALEGLLNVAKCGASMRRSEPTDAVVATLVAATATREGPLHGASVRFGTDIKSQMASVALSGVARQCGDWIRARGWRALVAYVLRAHALGLLPDSLERSLGGYSEDLTAFDGTPLPPSRLVPGWWPSQRSDADSVKEGNGAGESRVPAKKPAARMNGFFALIAASIGGDAGMGADENENDARDSNPPSYLQMETAEDAEAEELARKCIASCRFEDVIINEAKILRSDALVCVAESLAGAALGLMKESMEQNRAQELASVAEVSDVDGMPAVEPLPSGADFKPPGLRNAAPGSTRSTGPGYGGVVSDASSIITGTARVVRSNMSSLESDVGVDGYAGSGMWNSPGRDNDERKARDCVVAFCIDVLCELTLQNRDRLHIPWPHLHQVLLTAIDRNTGSLAVVERAVVALLRIASRLLHRTELRSDVLRGLNLLINLPSASLEELSVPVAAGVLNIVRTHSAVVSSVSGWHAILSIVENCSRYSSMSRSIGFDTLRFLLNDDPAFKALSSETYAPLLDAILGYCACSSVELSMQALDILRALSAGVPALVSATQTEANDQAADAEGPNQGRGWSEYWGPLLRGFATAARDPRGKVRNHSIAALETVIASSGSGEFLSATEWDHAMSTIIFPLLQDLFGSNGLLGVTLEAERSAQRQLTADRHASRQRSSRQSGASDHDVQLLRTVKAACDRTRLRAVVLTSKTFLQHHARMAAGLKPARFTELWLGVLDCMKRALQGGTEEHGIAGGHTLLSSGNDDELREHVPECVKNILLVMCSSGLLNKDTEPERWEATFDALRDFLPEMEELVQLVTNAPPAPDSGAATNSAANGEPVVTSSSVPVSDGVVAADAAPVPDPAPAPDADAKLNTGAAPDGGVSSSYEQSAEASEPDSEAPKGNTPRLQEHAGSADERARDSGGDWEQEQTRVVSMAYIGTTM